MFIAKSGLNPGRYIYFVLWLAFLIGSHLVLRLKPNMSLKGLYVFSAGFYFYKFVLYPPIPWTLFITYMMLQALFPEPEMGTPDEKSLKPITDEIN